jgi:NAD(P)-dependent dehydrogenase (short-subunit alcohol dehydrogenase family)
MKAYQLKGKKAIVTGGSGGIARRGLKSPAKNW